MIIVVGSPNSSNSNRLREVGEQYGVQSYLIPGPGDINPDWFGEATAVGVTAGASAPEILVDGVLERLRELGATKITEMSINQKPFVLEISLMLKS